MPFLNTPYSNPPPVCPNTCASQMKGDLTPAPQSPSHLLGSLHLNTKFKGLLSLLQTMKARWIPGSKIPLLSLLSTSSPSHSLTPLFNWLLLSLPTSWDVNTLCSCSDLALMLSQVKRPPCWIRQENCLNMARLHGHLHSQESYGRELATQAVICLSAQGLLVRNCWIMYVSAVFVMDVQH